MVTALAARWLVTVVFAATGLAAARPRRRTGTATTSKRSKLSRKKIESDCASRSVKPSWASQAAPIVRKLTT
jgi:hypothetical protein